MADGTHVLAIDLGASGGRVIRGTWNEREKKISLDEIHRFANEAVEIQGTLYWDILRLFHEIKVGIRTAVRSLTDGQTIACIGIDTWGVDFGLLDKNGQLLGNPVHYRDQRTQGVVDRLNQRLGSGWLFSRTGIQDAWFNTINQMVGALERDSSAFDGAETLLFIPDLLNYFLTGRKAAEHSIASTSQLLQAGQPEWSTEIFQRLGLPRRLMQAIVEPGTLLGPIRTELAVELGLAEGTPLAIVPSHDTESAALAVPAGISEGTSFAFVSCGTWSVMGAELSQPVLTDICRQTGFSNEAGADGRNYLLRNIMGMWLLQECKRCWERDGCQLDHAALVDLAATAHPWRYHIDVTHNLFASPGDMPRRVAAYCGATGQPIPHEPADILRCIIESLACSFCQSLADLELQTGYNFDTLWIVGGGSRNYLLCKVTAQLIKRPVTAGPTETTALGNILSQLRALNRIASLAEARAAVAASFGVERYVNTQESSDQVGYENWRTIIAKAPAEISLL